MANAHDVAQAGVGQEVSFLHKQETPKRNTRTSVITKFLKWEMAFVKLGLEARCRMALGKS
eukprot:1602626-Prymnesium_polylepis.1